MGWGWYQASQSIPQNEFGLKNHDMCFSRGEICLEILQPPFYSNFHNKTTVFTLLLLVPPSRHHFLLI